MTTTNGTRAKAKPTPTALNFGIDGRAARRLKDTEYYYRIELADGREAVIAASNVTVKAGALIAWTREAARKADEELELPAREASAENTLILAPGTWLSVYMCEAILAEDPWSILALPKPEK
jgi:hypothetical protein